MIPSSSTPPPELRSLVDAELRSGERVVWMEQPLANRFARSSIPLVLFGVPWTAFAVFWIVAAAWGTSRGHAPGPFKLFPLFGIPFVLIGVGMLSSPYWLRRSAARTLYVLTDRRAILFAASWGSGYNIRSFEPEKLSDLQRRQNADGSGDLIFTQEWGNDNAGWNNVNAARRRSMNVGFLAIRDVKAVEEMVRKMATEAGPPPMRTGNRTNSAAAGL